VARQPRFGRPYVELAFQPMLELLAFLRASGLEALDETARGWTVVDMKCDGCACSRSRVATRKSADEFTVVPRAGRTGAADATAGPALDLGPIDPAECGRLQMWGARFKRGADRSRAK
jgi:hypothetical protein